MTNIIGQSISAPIIAGLVSNEAENEADNSCFYSLFDSYIDRTLIDGKLSRIRARGPEHDLDRIKAFSELQDLTLWRGHREFGFMLMADRSHNWWRFELSIDTEIIYECETRLINHDGTLDHETFSEYEKTYLRHVFLKTVPLLELQFWSICDPSEYDSSYKGLTVDEAIDGLLAIAKNKIPATHKERLDDFYKLILNVPFEAIDIVKRSVSVDLTNKKWFYRLSVENLEIFESEFIDIGDGSVLSKFQHHVLLQTFRAVLPEQPHSLCPLLHNDGCPSLAYEDSGLGPTANLLKSFAKLSCELSWHKFPFTSITFDKSTFQLRAHDEIVFESKFPDSPPGQGLTARVHTVMSAIRMECMKNYIALKSVLTHQNNPDQPNNIWRDEHITVTLRQAIENNGSPIQGIYFRPQLSNYPRHQLEVVSSEGVMRTFMTSEGNGYIKNPDYQLKVWRGLIVENLVYIYQKAERLLNKCEILALHAQMHKTKYGQFSLGDIMAIPKPDATKILEAFGGDEPEF